MPDILQSAISLIYEPNQWQLSHFEQEKESQEYSACRFQLNRFMVICRTAKITPTKTGQFVTLWKRTNHGPIQPFEATDQVDLFVINVLKGDSLGQFIFPKEALLSKGVISTNNKEGKRAIRVYPPWDTVTSKQAEKTQRWQSEFFISLDSSVPIDHEKVRKLYLQGL